jgi:hypothetical protein
MHVDPSATNATVTGAIRQAARMTGTDFRYLLATAKVESNFKADAKAATSSARGLFQFIEQTWLQTLKEQGPALGYGPYADAISRRPSGEYVVSEPRLHGAILSLRSDPSANAMMAGAFTRANAARLAGKLGRAPTEGELYIAHFLGPTGANRLIGLSESRPMTPAAAVFPGAAQANRSIFYDRDGRARSAGEVYRALLGRYQIARAGRGAPEATQPALAANQSAPRITADLDRTALADTYALYALAATAAVRGGDIAAATAKPVAAQRRRAIALDRVALADTYELYTLAPAKVTRGKRTPATAATSKVAAPKEGAPPPQRAAGRESSASADGPVSGVRTASTAAAVKNSGPVFHGLFRTTGADEPVAPIVSSLWTTPTSTPARKPIAQQGAAQAPAVGPLDLFQEHRPDARALFRGRV